MVTRWTLETREQWLEARKNRIGGSDAAAIIGMNPYKTNIQLWEEKTGRKQPADISDMSYVKYGIEAEDYLRKLFKLDFPEYEVLYQEGNMWLNDKYPYAHASLDGWLVEQKGRKGVWECKTTEIMNAAMKEKWKDRIPDNYYIQLLHYLLVTEFDFAILKAQLKYDIQGDVFLTTKHYKIERLEVDEDIKFLAEKESEFWQYVKDDKKPNLILPVI